MSRLAAILLAALTPAVPLAGALAQESRFDAFPPDSSAPAAPAPAAPPPARPAAPAAAPAHPPDTWQDRPFVVLVGLDKVSARATRLSGPVGRELTFGTLTVLPRTCVVRPPEVTVDAAAYLEITDARLGTPPFHGWMLLSEPSVSIFEHPVYDIRLVGCRSAP